jgi:hypothetical protein
MDPLEALSSKEPAFSLLEPRLILESSKIRGLELRFPEASIFILWLAKVCKAPAWRDLLLLVYELRRQYSEHLYNMDPKKAQSSWKSFISATIDRLKQQEDQRLTGHSQLFTRSLLLQFLRLYGKWTSLVVGFN